jgi:chromosome condensin MukBEF MukE localization factor
MENATAEVKGYDFFTEDIVEKHFADLNIKLLSGRHIQQEDINAFLLLEDFYPDLRNFYRKIYQLDLVRDIGDQRAYFYLDFFDGGKGKLNDASRYRALTEMQTVTGLLLLDMYYSRYFEHPKVIMWSDIKQEIEEGDHKADYQRILFPEIRAAYSDAEWGTVEKRFKDVIQSFHLLGWVNRLSGQQEELLFEIRPSIHRMAVLYAAELENFTSFSENYKSRAEE